MQIDAASYAEQLAYYEIYSAENRLTNKLSTLQSQKSMVSKIDNALDALDNLLYKFTKPTGSFSQSAVSLSSEDYFSVDAAGYAKNINMDIFVEQTAAAHQVAIKGVGSEATDSFATVGSGNTIEIEFDGTTYTIDVDKADSNGDSDVSYQELANYFNSEMEGMVNASLVRSGGEMQLLFSSEETGAGNAFEITANTTGADTSVVDAFTVQNTVKEGRDAIIWLGDYGTGVELSNSSNTFENIVAGVDITVSKANAEGDETTNFSIGPDSDATIETLKEFITAFNDVLSVLDDATSSGGESEDRGVLASDGSIRGIENALKSVLRSNYDGVTMFQIGLSFNKDGTLELDEEAFAEAADNYDLEELFLGENGMFRTLESTVEKYADYTSGSLETKKQRLSDQQSQVNDKLDLLDTKYEMYYSRYLAQFTNLNNIMNQMSSITTLFV